MRLEQPFKKSIRQKRARCTWRSSWVRPVASGYLGGIRTRQTARHCQAATSGASGWSSSPGGPLTHWKAPPYHGARQPRWWRLALDSSH